MFQTRYRLFCALSLAAAGLILPCATLAGTSHAYLTWQNKTPQAEAPVQSTPPQPLVQSVVQSGGQSYPIPPSPYGQVGAPYARALNWPTKGITVQARQQTQPTQPAPLAQQPVQTFAPVPAPPIRDATLASVSVPVPVNRPAPVAVIALPSAPKSVPVAKAAPITPQTGYQVPATSKYAARLNALHATADAQAAQQAPVVATAPATSEPLAAQETDHVFIPGEHYTDASDEPRLYSLHRQYGLKPDPIMVDHDATGALLSPGTETARFDAQSDQDGDGDAADKDDMKNASDTQTDSQTQPKTLATKP